MTCCGCSGSVWQEQAGKEEHGKADGTNEASLRSSLDVAAVELDWQCVQHLSITLLVFVVFVFHYLGSVHLCVYVLQTVFQWQFPQLVAEL